MVGVMRMYLVTHHPPVSKTAAFDEFSIHGFAILYRQRLFLISFRYTAIPCTNSTHSQHSPAIIEKIDTHKET